MEMVQNFCGQWWWASIKPQPVSLINTALERALSSNPNNECNLRERAKDSYTIKEDVKNSFEEVAKEQREDETPRVAQRMTARLTAAADTVPIIALGLALRSGARL